MRKDMFLGMTIGGGLLAVIIGYLIFHSGSKHAGQTADNDTGKTQQESGETGITPGPDVEKGANGTASVGDNKSTGLMAVNDKVWGPLLDGKPVITTPGVNGVTDTPGGGTKPTG